MQRPVKAFQLWLVNTEHSKQWTDGRWEELNDSCCFIQLQIQYYFCFSLPFFLSMFYNCNVLLYKLILISWTFKPCKNVDANDDDLGYSVEKNKIKECSCSWCTFSLFFSFYLFSKQSRSRSALIKRRSLRQQAKLQGNLSIVVVVVVVVSHRHRQKTDLSKVQWKWQLTVIEWWHTKANWRHLKWLYAWFMASKEQKRERQTVSTTQQ